MAIGELKQASVDADSTQGERAVPVRIVDCDVHPMPAGNELLQFLPAQWHHTEKPDTRVPFRVDHVNNGSRVDARPTVGEEVGRAGSDPRLFERQLLGEAGVDLAVLIYHSHRNLPHPDADAARCSAINEWLAALWLGDYNGHGRYRGSLRVPMHSPAAAVAEIHRWADNPNFVQVIAVASYAPAFGHPMYEPILRAAAECGLPVAVHPTGNFSPEGTPYGPQTYHFEWHALAFPYPYIAHLTSLVCNGVFERIPDLKFVMVEGGVSWSHALGNHLDKNWDLLHGEVPELTLAPSEYLRRQVLFTSQPIEEPRDDASLLQVYEEIGAESRLMFSTDYPHWDYDDPKLALPRMPEQLRRRVMAETACELYGLPRTRPVAVTDEDR